MDISDPIRFLNRNRSIPIMESECTVYRPMAFTKVVSLRSYVSRAQPWTYMIYVRDNVVVQNAGHYQVNKPRQGEPGRDAERRCLASP